MLRLWLSTDERSFAWRSRYFGLVSDSSGIGAEPVFNATSDSTSIRTSVASSSVSTRLRTSSRSRCTPDSTRGKLAGDPVLAVEGAEAVGARFAAAGAFDVVPDGGPLK